MEWVVVTLKCLRESRRPVLVSLQERQRVQPD